MKTNQESTTSSRWLISAEKNRKWTKSYEYIRLAVDMGDLSELNELSSVGFRVVAVVDDKVTHLDPDTGGVVSYPVHYALMERECPESL